MKEKNFSDFINNKKETKVQNVFKIIINKKKKNINQNFIQKEKKLKNLKKNT